MRHNYCIVEITEHAQLLHYIDYAEWYIIFTEMAYEYYLDFGKRRLYILERDNYKYLSPTEGDGYPYGSYGLSLIAVIVNDNGTTSSVTTRWNSLYKDEGNVSMGNLLALIGNCTYSYHDNTYQQDKPIAKP